MFHKKEEKGSFERIILFRYKKSVEYRVVERSVPLRYKERHFDMPDDNKHKPSECYACMHVSEQNIAFEYLHMQKAVANYIPKILDYDLGVYK